MGRGELHKQQEAQGGEGVWPEGLRVIVPMQKRTSVHRIANVAVTVHGSWSPGCDRVVSSLPTQVVLESDHRARSGSAQLPGCDGFLPNRNGVEEW